MENLDRQQSINATKELKDRSLVNYTLKTKILFCSIIPPPLHSVDKKLLETFEIGNMCMEKKEVCFLFCLSDDMEESSPEQDSTAEKTQGESEADVEPSGEEKPQEEGREEEDVAGSGGIADSDEEEKKRRQSPAATTEDVVPTAMDDSKMEDVDLKEDAGGCLLTEIQVLQTILNYKCTCQYNFFMHVL